jgi:hypothetical protein
MATTLRSGDVAIIAYATDDGFHGNGDIIRFVVLKSIAAGTVIYLTDRNWTPTPGSAILNAGSFAAPGGGEGTFAYTAGAGGIAAGTVITITSAQLAAAGINLSDGGDTIYIYQGTDANTPTGFLFAMEVGDGNTEFTSNLVNTGLVAGVHTVSIAHDQAVYQHQGLGAPGAQLASIVNSSHWYGNDTNDLNANTYDDRIYIERSGPLNAGDMQLFGAMTGGGQADAIVRVDNDFNDTASNIGTNLARLLRDHPAFISMEDIAFDLEDGVWFAVMNEGTDITRIVKGQIADLRENNQSAVFTVIYEYNNDSANSNDDKFIQGIELDKTTNRIYFTLGDILDGHKFMSVDYNGGALRDWGLIDLARDNTVGFAGGIEDFVIDSANNTAYFTYVLVEVGSPSVVHQNYIVRLTGGLNTSAPNPNVENYAIVNLGMPADGSLVAGRLNPVEGSLRGIDIDPVTGTLWFVTGGVNANGNGGIFKYHVASGTLTEVWNQPANNAHNTPQAFPTTLLHDIEVDSIGGRYYITDQSNTDHAFDNTPSTDENGGNIWSGALNAAAGTAPILFHDNFDPNGGAVKGMEINYAPTIVHNSAVNVGYTESTSALNSPAGTPINVGGSTNINDVDTGNLKGALVSIGGFVPGDVLAATLSGGITGSYNAATGVLTLSGSATFAAYQTVLNSVTFTNAGDNPTEFGRSTTRAIAFQVHDGLSYSDPAISNVTVTGINDAPVNIVGGAMSFTEDTTGSSANVPVNAITGISISDVDADPATQLMTMTLSVTKGILNIRTDVVGGLTAGQVAGNGTGALTLTGTQNAINATLAATVTNTVGGAPNGLVYTPTANYNGADTLTVITNDMGNNGNDPGLTGTGVSEADTDFKTLSIADVNDAPTVSAATQTAAAILEDAPYTNSNAPTVATLFGGSFSDALDTQFNAATNPTGSTGDTLAGIAIVSATSNANGAWQYWTGTAWVNITGGTQAAARTLSADTQIRFNPVQDYNGAAPTLTVHLIESGGTAITNNGTINLSAGGSTGGTTVYTTGTVVLSQSITAVNDAPVLSQSTVTTPSYTENAAALQLLAGGMVVDVDAANFAGGSLTVSVTGSNNSLALPNADGFSNQGAAGYWYNGTKIADLSSTANQISLTNFTAAMTPAVMNLLLDNFTYQATGDNPGGADRTVTFSLNDGGNTGSGGAQIGTVTQTVKVIPVNDAPFVAATGGTTSFVEGVNTASTPVVVDTLVSVGDADNTTLVSAKVSITGNFQAGQDVLAFVNNNAASFGNIAAAYNSATGVLTLTSAGAEATLAQFQAALRAVTYTNSSEEPNTGNRTISFEVNDGALASTVSTKTVSVAAQNDSPSGTSSTITINEDAVRTLSEADFGFSDVDGDAFRSVRFGTAPTGGTLFFDADGAGGAAPVAITTFPSGEYLVTDINLGKLTFVPAANTNGAGAATITFTVVDDGGTAGVGQNADTSPNVLTLNINAVNDAPAGANNGASVMDNATHVFTVADFAAGMTDANDSPANSFAGVRITTLPPVQAGVIYYDADGAGGAAPVAISAGDSFNAQDLSTGKLTFVPAAGSGNTEPVFTFQVRDNGGTANGGVDLDPNPDTFTLTIGQSNIAPDIDLDEFTSGKDAEANYVEDDGALLVAPNLTVSDDDDAALVAAKVSVGAGFIAGADALTINGTASGTVTGISYSYNSATGILTLAGTASLAEYQTLLRLVKFDTSSDTPGTSREIAFTINDGVADSAIRTAVLTITEANDAPVVDLNGAAAGIDAALAYTEGDDRVAITPGVVVSDPDSGNFDGGQLLVSGMLDAADRIELIGDAFEVDPEDDRLIVNGVNIGTVTIGTDFVQIDFNANATAALIQQVLRAVHFVAQGDAPTGGDRTITYELTDGDGGTSMLATATVTVTPVDDPAVPADDTGSVAENGTTIIHVLANDADPDGPGQRVTHVDGQPIAPGGTVTLSGSGARVTLNHDGTLTYDPNGKFNELTDNTTGGTNLSDTDSFTYTEGDGGTATVTVTVNGVASAGDRIVGGPGDNTFTVDDFEDEVIENPDEGNDTVKTALGGRTASPSYSDLYVIPANVENLVGTAAGNQGVRDNGLDNVITMNGGDDLVVADQGGADQVDGGGGNDFLYFGGTFGAGDIANGGAGTDTLAMLAGGGATFGADQLVSIERLAVYSSTLNGPGEHSYTLVMDDGNVAAGEELFVTAASLKSDETLTFDGSKETDGRFTVLGGAGDDLITGGAQKDFLAGRDGDDILNGGGGNDVLVGGRGADKLTGGTGKDWFRYEDVAESNLDDGVDTIIDYEGSASGERIDLSAIDADINMDGNQAFTWIGTNAAFTEQAGQLRVVQTDGKWFVEGDVDGDGVADIVIHVDIGLDYIWSSSDFIV